MVLVYFYVRQPVLTPAEERALRLQAQERWLSLYAQSPKEALSGWDNAHLFMSCFKEGEAAAYYEKVFATAREKDQHPIIQNQVAYYWIFVVDEKARNKDERELSVFVRVSGKPSEPRNPVIERVESSFLLQTGIQEDAP
jgi:hypothetical protein